MSTKINELKEDTRCSIRGVLREKRAVTNKAGKMLNFCLVDETGSVRCFGFEETLEVFQDVLKNGDTYTVTNVTAKKGRDDALEIKIYKDTRIDKARPLKLESVCVTLKDAKEMTAQIVTLKCVVHDLEGASQLSSGDPCTKAQVIDATGTMYVYFTDDAAAVDLTEGSVLDLTGKITTKGALFVSTPPRVVEDDPLAEWYTAEASAKKMRVVFDTLDDVAKAAHGDKGTVVAVVTSVAMNVTVLANGRSKRAITVADKTKRAIDLAVFDAGAAIDVNIGDTLKADVTVSPYMTKSLTTNHVQILEDHALSAWSDATPDETFVNMSVPQDKDE